MNEVQLAGTMACLPTNYTHDLVKNTYLGVRLKQRFEDCIIEKNCDEKKIVKWNEMIVPVHYIKKPPPVKSPRNQGY